MIRLPTPVEAILPAYLDRFRKTVQRYFPVPAGSDQAAEGPSGGVLADAEVLGNTTG